MVSSLDYTYLIISKWLSRHHQVLCLIYIAAQGQSKFDPPLDRFLGAPLLHKWGGGVAKDGPFRVTTWVMCGSCLAATGVSGMRQCMEPGKQSVYQLLNPKTFQISKEHTFLRLRFQLKSKFGRCKHIGIISGNWCRVQQRALTACIQFISHKLND